MKNQKLLFLLLYSNLGTAVCNHISHNCTYLYHCGEQSAIVCAIYIDMFCSLFVNPVNWKVLHRFAIDNCLMMQRTWYVCYLFTAQCTLVHLRGLGIACRLSVRL